MKSKLLDFCDKYRITFDISFRYEAAGKIGRFYVHFPCRYKLKYFEDGDMNIFHFINGKTPSEVLRNADRFFKGKYIEFQYLLPSNVGSPLKWVMGRHSF